MSAALSVARFYLLSSPIYILMSISLLIGEINYTIGLIMTLILSGSLTYLSIGQIPEQIYRVLVAMNISDKAARLIFGSAALLGLGSIVASLVTDYEVSTVIVLIAFFSSVILHVSAFLKVLGQK
jgi:hypothetical protein